MAKILTDTELLHIVTMCITGGEIDDRDQYRAFLTDLTRVVTDHFGGRLGSVCAPDDICDYWSVAIHQDENVPAGGGIYKHYDQDVDWDVGD